MVILPEITNVETDIPSVRVDFGKDAIYLIEPKPMQFPVKHSSGTIEKIMLL